MSAIQESRIKKLGIIAGGGDLPEKLLYACDKNNIEPFVVGFKGHTNENVFDGRNHLLTRLGAAGHVIETLKAHDIRDLVMIGAIQRPSLHHLRPDMWTAKFVAKVGLKALGDDGLLKAIREAIEKEGFVIHGLQKFAQDLVVAEGNIGKYSPSKSDIEDIKRGVNILKTTAALDIGQSVIVQQGIVLGLEAIEGTNNLIKRSKEYHRKGKGGVLVKLCKEQQDKDLDLPTIGPETIKYAIETGLSGVVIHANNSLVVSNHEVAEIADRAKIFVTAIDPDKFLG